MSYLVTARKWRPNTFEEIVGQEHISTTLKNAVISKRIAHAFIFAGPRGIGKTTTARIFAKVLNCVNVKDGEPCNECSMCKSFNSSQSLDIIEIDGASNRRIEEIRSLRESVKYAPTKGEYKVYIIDEVHMLTTESFNALLKTLEEPPEHTIFIFATTDVHKVPMTIISRCQRFDFRRVELKAIKIQLQKIADAEEISIDDQSLTIISKKADGALRDAEGLFDQVVSFCGKNITADEVSKMLNLIDDEIYFDLSDAVLAKNFTTAFDISTSIYSNGWNYIDFVSGLIEHFRNIMTVIIKGDTSLIESSEIYLGRFEAYKGKFDESDLLRILSFLNQLGNEVKNSTNQKLKIEIALCHLIGIEKTATISELLNNLGSDSGSISSIKKKANPTPVIKKNNFNENLTSAQKVVPVNNSIAIETQAAGLDFNWGDFIDELLQDKPVLASHLVDSTPQILDNKLHIQLNTNEDIEILNKNKDFNEFLQKRIKSKINKNITIKYTADTSNTFPRKPAINDASSLQNLDTHLSKDESSLVNAILKELGGLELRS